MSSDNVADQAGGEWKWALSKTKGKVYMYNTADQNKVFWLHDLKDAYQAYVTCKDAIDEADQAGGEWKWALSKTKGKVYMYNTADQNDTCALTPNIYSVSLIVNRCLARRTC